VASDRYLMASMMLVGSVTSPAADTTNRYIKAAETGLSNTCLLFGQIVVT